MENELSKEKKDKIDYKRMEEIKGIKKNLLETEKIIEK